VGRGARFLECGLLHADDAALPAAVRAQSRDTILAEAVLVRELQDDEGVRHCCGRHGLLLPSSPRLRQDFMMLVDLLDFCLHGEENLRDLIGAAR
jgi:hypothetical protein